MKSGFLSIMFILNTCHIQEIGFLEKMNVDYFGGSRFHLDYGVVTEKNNGNVIDNAFESCESFVFCSC